MNLLIRMFHMSKINHNNANNLVKRLLYNLFILKIMIQYDDITTIITHTF